jgi:hypothetical protein
MRRETLVHVPIERRGLAAHRRGDRAFLLSSGFRRTGRGPAVLNVIKRDTNGREEQYERAYEA